MVRDHIYLKGIVAEDFTFNEQVAHVFDDMLNRSIPFYSEVTMAIAELIRLQHRASMTICDLGCATGTTLIALALQLADLKCRFIGIDNAPAMLVRAKQKARQAGIPMERFTLIEDDITVCDFGSTDVFLVNYTLQVLRPLVRQQFLNRLSERIADDGMVIISEKVISSDPRINQILIHMYHQFKKERGYSDLEIAAKREALENVLVPFTVAENMAMLREAGFARVEVFCRWFNFASFLAFKK